MTIQEALSRQLAQFPMKGRQRLSEIVTDPSFIGVISPAQATEITAQIGFSVNELLDALVPIARCYASPPISNYHVGTVVRGASGALYMGGNLEFPGLGLNMTVHGEQAAVVNARLHGETNINALAVSGTPCGHCRQFLAEINNPDLAIIFPLDKDQTLSDVLPHAFAPDSLGSEKGMLEPNIPLPPLTLDSDDELDQAALEMARQSHAPYSKNLAGLAVRLADGFIAAAPYLETAAFNPSLSPLQNVLVAMRLRRRPWQDIEDAVLVEQQSSLSSQRPMSRALLATLGDVSLRYHAI